MDYSGGLTNKEKRLGVFGALAILAVILAIIFVSLHFTCTWSLFNTTQCLCEKHGGLWDSTKSSCSLGITGNQSPTNPTPVITNPTPVITNPTPVITNPGCATPCLNGIQTTDCLCQCKTGWTGLFCEVPVISPGFPEPDPLPVEEPIIKATFPTGGTFTIKAPGKDLYLKTVGGSSAGNNQKLDDCKGTPGNCQWTFIPLGNNTYNIKASDADLYLRSGGGVMWLAGASWLSDPSTQFVLSYGDMSNSVYIRPLTSATKYVAVKGDWDQDDVPAIMSYFPKQNTIGCQWELVKV